MVYIENCCQKNWGLILIVTYVTIGAVMPSGAPLTQRRDYLTERFLDKTKKAAAFR